VVPVGDRDDVTDPVGARNRLAEPSRRHGAACGSAASYARPGSGGGCHDDQDAAATTWLRPGAATHRTELDAVSSSAGRGDRGVRLLYGGERSPRPRRQVHWLLRRRVRQRGRQVLRTPIRAPKANAHAERWIQTVRVECLDRTFVLGRRHLLRLLRGYVRHHDDESGFPHSTPRPPPSSVPRTDRCAAKGAVAAPSVVLVSRPSMAATAVRFVAAMALGTTEQTHTSSIVLAGRAPLTVGRPPLRQDEIGDDRPMIATPADTFPDRSHVYIRRYQDMVEAHQRR
jgi:hypothetical protein